MDCIREGKGQLWDPGRELKVTGLVLEALSSFRRGAGTWQGLERSSSQALSIGMPSSRAHTCTAPFSYNAFHCCPKSLSSAL